ncbi:hypothetical protein KSF73_16965 [Burkholderiaceae bacterium DAT-1]|nr:hypothetical protein [Burkholderiaceae bacterium DAT-1]
MTPYFRLIAATVTAVLLTSAHAEAHPPMADHGHGGSLFGLHAALIKLQPQLGLTAQQQALITAAQTATNNARTIARQQHDSMKSQLDTAMTQPVLNLDSLSQTEQAARQPVQAAMQTARTSWLAAYDALNDTQKALVSTALKATYKQHQAKMAEWMSKRPHH